MRGEWIEISIPPQADFPGGSLAPCGASGLKSFLACGLSCPNMSRPVRGEWIEIIITQPSSLAGMSLAPCGASGLK